MTRRAIQENTREFFVGGSRIEDPSMDQVNGIRKIQEKTRLVEGEGSGRREVILKETDDSSYVVRILNRDLMMGKKSKRESTTRGGGERDAYNKFKE